MEASVSESENFISVLSGNREIYFDRRLSEKKYPVLCFISRLAISDGLVDEIDSSGIVKVDTEFNMTSSLMEESSILLIPQTGFSTEKLTDVLCEVMRKF